MKIKFRTIYEDFEILNKLKQERFYKENYPKQVQQSKQFHRKMIKRFLNCIEKHKWLQRHEKSIFVGNVDRFDYLGSILSEKYNVFTFSRVNALRNSFDCFRYYPVNYEALLYKGFLKKDMSYARKVINNIKTFFTTHSISLVIMGCDRLFIERSIVVASKELNIPIIIFQHGIYVGEEIGPNKVGIYGNEFWTWSKFIKDIHEKAFPDYRILRKVMGYPFLIRKWDNLASKTLLFIGEGYKNQELIDGFDDVIRNVYTASKKLELSFVYRPHPGENKKRLFEKFGMLKGFSFSSNKDLIEDICGARVVVGDMSSVLTEAALVGCPVLIIQWCEYVTNITEHPMYSYSFKTDNNINSIFTNLNKIIDEKLKSKAIDDYYIYYNNHLHDNILQWTTELISSNERL